jgi:hypothetical protein
MNSSVSYNRFPKTILALLFGCLSTIANAYDDGAKPNPQTLGERNTVTLDKANQIKSGLKTILVGLAQYHAEYGAIGKVISIQSLMEFRESYLVAQADLDSAKARLKQAGQSLKRQQELFRSGIGTGRSVQEQQAQVSADRALVDTSQVRLMAITTEAQLQWGKALAEWVLAETPAELALFLSGQQQLLQVTLPTNKHLADDIRAIAVDLSCVRDKARPATLVSRAPRIDITIPGESYFFKAAGDGITVGSKVAAWVPEPSSGRLSVIVPESALVWHMGQVYVYIKTAQDTFTRRAVKDFSVTQDGFFVNDGITADEEIVATGGQMLLSEELRGQIPDED